MNRHFFASLVLAISIAVTMLSSCSKNEIPKTFEKIQSKSPQVFSYSSEVLDKWMTLQLRLIRNTTGVPNQAFSRHFAYSGVAALESLAPGLPAHMNWSRRWNGLTGLPQIDQSDRYYFPANVNAAMAVMNRSFFPNASAIDKAAIDSLENALKQEFLATEKQSVITASSEYGQAVATAVFNWAETDGYKTANAPYVPPVGAGLWVPTPPAFAPASTPYWGNNRTIITGSIINAHPVSIVSYSTDPNSEFYKMVKEVYDASQNLTDAQKAMAIFWRDVPGITSPGHWLSIVQQAIRQTESSLGKAALAYALTGVAVNDGLISCWKTKFTYNLVRPVTYIRDVMGHTTWTPFLGTPPHPEYPSAHSVLSIAAGEVMQKIFGNIGSFTDHSYDYLGFAPRTYSSFTAIGEEAGNSRLYAGIHYQSSIDAGLAQGRVVAANILQTK